MATLREIRKRIRSVRNIAKVTQAMETVAASKMRRAQQMTLASRPYAGLSREVLANLVAHMSPDERRQHPLLRARPPRTVMVVLISANRGLCGGYNQNVVQAAMDLIRKQTVPVQVVTVGHKGRDYLRRHGGSLDARIVGDFDLPEHPSAAEARPIARLATIDVRRGAVDRVWLVYTRFISMLRQDPTVQQLLPVEAGGSEAVVPQVSYLFEPRAPRVLRLMLRRYVEMQVYQALLEAVASEQSARMMAMRAAAENAHSLINDLTLTYNKARQEAITEELIDIVSGAAALNRNT